MSSIRITEGCVACKHYDWDCDDYGCNAQCWCEKSNAHNLPGFPFKKNAKCWEGKRDPGVFLFGAQRVRTTQNIKKGLFYEDERGKIAKVNDHFEGIVVLDWQDSGKQTQCKEQQFCKRFSLYGNGH